MAIKSKPHIIFIHRGQADYLEFSLKQALRFNPRERIHLIGDAAVAGYGSLVQFHPIEAFMAEANEFATIYEHYSTNPYDFELFCIQRWFILNNFLKHQNIDKCFYADSDLMIYFNAAQEYLRFANFDLTLSCDIDAHGSWWNSADVLKKFCDFVIRVYTKKDAKNYARALNHFAKLQWRGRGGGICDMTLLGLFRNLNPGGTAEATDIKDGSTYDDSVNISINGVDYYLMRYGIKKITWINGLPYSTLIKTGQNIQLKTLHCQNVSKPLMKVFYNYGQPNRLGYAIKFLTGKIKIRVQRLLSINKQSHTAILTKCLRSKLYPWRTQEIKRKIFLDCGSNKGQGFKKFREFYGMDSSWEAYLFEPTKELNKILTARYAGESWVHCLNKAVWTQDGKIDFFISYDDGGSSIFKDVAESTGATMRKMQAGKRGIVNQSSEDFKRYSGSEKIFYSVDSVDFSLLVQRLSRPDDYIVIKMDIEGAEYKVLRKMLADGIFRLIDEIYIEFHERFVLDESPEANRALMEAIEKQGAIAYEWD
jgi:FkbM family methyltransferase